MLLVTHSIEEAIKLVDRIVTLTRCPCRVRDNILVDLPRSRSEDDPVFIALRWRIRDLIYDDAEAII
jgi:NitT/TauT family transport system ATP-binding protein